MPKFSNSWRSKTQSNIGGEWLSLLCFPHFCSEIGDIWSFQQIVFGTTKTNATCSPLNPMSSRFFANECVWIPWAKFRVICRNIGKDFFMSKFPCILFVLLFFCPILISVDKIKKLVFLFFLKNIDFLCSIFQCENFTF